MLARLPKPKSAPAGNATIAYFDWHWLGRNRTTFALLLASLCALLALGSGLSQRTDEQLRVVREGMLSRPASGNIVILEIDAKSIAAVASWPWPRGIHGKIVAKLSAAGVPTIAFDVDFSSASTTEQDGRFAEALRRFDGTIILPTFVQKAESGGTAYVENVPIEPLRANAFLASVNVEPDSDGAIRNISYGTVTDGVPRPTMAAVLANAKGDIGRQFRVDTSIDPGTLPRVSVIDLLTNKVPSASLRGKSVFIGATAIELGDRYAMPRHGIQPGVIIQALAAETLISRNDFGTIGQWLSICLAFCAAIWAIRCRHIGATLIVGSAGVLTLLLLPLALEYLAVATIDVATGIYALSANSLVLLTAHFLGRFNSVQLIDQETGLGNERAMALDLVDDSESYVITMHIKNFGDVVAMMGDDRSLILLQNVAERLRLGSGETDIYRLGKGKLGWIAPTGNLTQITEMVEGLQALLTGNITVGIDKVTINAFFGIASRSGNTVDVTINNANVAANQALLSGNKWAVFNSAMSDRTGYVQNILSSLDEAIDGDEIFLLYQPKWSLSEQRVTGVEALVRWNHGTLGPISPAEFIPILEQNNQIARLTLEIAKKCGNLAREWLLSNRDASIAMNISAPLFMDAHFTKSLNSLLVDIGPARKLINLEITESAAVTDAKEIIASLQALREKGIKISIDDYGTGQSTLSYLQKFPADEIKIDQSFISNVLHSRSDQALVRSTIELGHELGLTVIAEGVEDQATMTLLETYGCDMIQGWYTGRPMTFSDVEMMIDAGVDHRLAATG